MTGPQLAVNLLLGLCLWCVTVLLVVALLRWAEGGAKPTPSSIAQGCEALQARFGAGCRLLPDFQPKALDTRVAPRERH